MNDKGAGQAAQIDRLICTFIVLVSSDFLQPSQHFFSHVEERSGSVVEYKTRCRRESGSKLTGDTALTLYPRLSTG